MDGSPCPPVIPGTYNGRVTINGQRAPDGMPIRAVIDGVGWSGAVTRAGRYVMDVPMVIPTTPPCFVGGMVTFDSGDLTAVESVAWASGLHDLDLTFRVRRDSGSSSPERRDAAVATPANQMVRLDETVLDLLDARRGEFVSAQEIAERLGADVTLVEGYLDLLGAEAAVQVARTFGGYTASITPLGSVRAHEGRAAAPRAVGAPLPQRARAEVTERAAQQERDTPREEAVELLRQCVDDLANDNFGLEKSLMKALRAAHLLRWTNQGAMLYYELNGYPPEAAVPLCRHAWLTGRDVGVALSDQRIVVAGDPGGLNVRNDVFQVRLPLYNLLPALPVGIEISRGQRRRVLVGGTSVQVRRVRAILPAEIARLLVAIRQYYYALASWWLAGLQSRALASDFFQEHGDHVDAAVVRLGLADTMRAAVETLRRDDPEGCRQSVFAIRHVLTELSRKLWRVQVHRYEPLQIDVQSDAGVELVKNKLRAWLHQKGLRRSKETLIEQHMMWLADYVNSLFDFESTTAKGSVTYEDARACLVNTYVFLGEIATRTDLEPVTQVCDGPPQA